MGDRTTTGVLVVLVSCDDPSKVDEMNQWYNETHIPDILATGCYFSATRYENTRTRDGDPTYVAIYETDWDDPAQAFKELRKRTAAHGPPPPYIKSHGGYTYLYIGPDREGVTEIAKSRIGAK